MPSLPFAPKQSLGQNFLHDPNIVRKIADLLQAPPEAHVVEVGAGTGALTEELVARYDRLTAIEIDARAVEVLRRALPDLDVRQEDVLETHWAALADEKGGSPLHVISNMPYYLTSPLLFALLDARAVVAEAVLMMQKEVAERIVAAPRTKAYGILSVVLQLYAAPQWGFTVSRNVFTPRPDVTSAVVRFDFTQPHPSTEGLDRAFVQKIVRAAFNQRRKMLRNSLRPWSKNQGVTLPHDWGRRRAEALAPEDFAELARFLRAEAEPVNDGPHASAGRGAA
jgi:16S rRNA (adenine1518-N6/adenine1519-N6)-dimethyltransferase